MTTRAAEFTFNGSTVPYASYDSTKTTLGPLIVQNSGGTNLTNYAGPFQPVVSRPGEASPALIVMYPYAIDIGNGTHWVFFADNSGAAATRKIVLYTFNTSTLVLSCIGFITLTYPQGGTHTIRSLIVIRHLYTTGTVTVSGTGVTGSGTGWQTAGYAVGGRIGFGSTSPTSITTWYIISAIGSDSSITLSQSGPSVSGSTFVIEELRVYTTTSNGTAAQGGLWVAKGVNFSDFTVGGTTISAATSTDNIKAVYGLRQTLGSNTVVPPNGLAALPTYTDTSHVFYYCSSAIATQANIIKFNTRASLTSGMSGGLSAQAFVYSFNFVVSGTQSVTDAYIAATLNHGPGAGVLCLYFITQTRIYRLSVSDMDNIEQNMAFTMFSDAMFEIPPGSTNTFAATSALSTLVYSSLIDRLIVMAGNAQKGYVTKYNTNALPIDRTMFSNGTQLEQSTSDAGIANFLDTTTNIFSVEDLNGYTYFCRNSATNLNQIYVVPLDADWDFAATTNCRLISPSIATPNCTKFLNIYVRSNRLVGSANLGMQPEPFRVYCRTVGITTNSGTWILLDDTGDMSGIAPAGNIQFMFEFRIIGPICIPAKIYGFSVAYTDNATDSHYQPSVALSNISAKIFAWRFATAFGGTVPTLNVYIYDAVTNNLMLTDNTVSATYGIFQKSTDGVTWGSYNTTDLANTTTYIRYAPTYLGDNIKVRAILTQQ